MPPESTIASTGTILIIDDSPDNLRVLSKTLRTHGYTVRCATNGAIAFISIRNSPPDLILLDIRMPGMDGYQVCQQLQQDPSFQTIPVIFLSALDDVKDIVRGFQVGGVDYITKPFQAEEVLARIHNQLTIQNLRKQLFNQNQQLLQEVEERKKTEQALHQEIQRRILIEASLQDAKNVADAAHYVKSEFLAHISHELRTPLNVILGLTNLMQGESSLPPLQRDHVTMIDASAQQLLRLINNILALTRTESNQLSLNEQEIDLHLLLDSLALLWQQKALTKGLQFEFHRSQEVPQRIYSDASKLRQILMHLLDNALQVTEQGEICIRVEVANPQASLNRPCLLMIEVQDSSPDQPPEATSTSQAALTQTLGLKWLLVGQFAQLMGGNLSLKSLPGKGNVARIQLQVNLADTRLAQPFLQPPSSLCGGQSLIGEGTLSLESLKLAMPEDWCVQLHQAAVKGFDQQILDLLEKVPASHAALATILEGWTRDFQFDRIVEITNPTAL